MRKDYCGPKDFVCSFNCEALKGGYSFSCHKRPEQPLCCGPVWFGVAQVSHTWVFSKGTHGKCHLTQELAGAYKSPCMQLNSGMAFRLQLLVLLFPLVLPMARARAVCHFDFMTGEGSDGCRPGVFGGVRRGVMREISYIEA